MFKDIKMFKTGLGFQRIYTEAEPCREHCSFQRGTRFVRRKHTAHGAVLQNGQKTGVRYGFFKA